jgi:hypothetical protein
MAAKWFRDLGLPGSPEINSFGLWYSLGNPGVVKIGALDAMKQAGAAAFYDELGVAFNNIDPLDRIRAGKEMLKSARKAWCPIKAISDSSASDSRCTVPALDSRREDKMEETKNYKGYTLKPVNFQGNWIVEVVGADQRTMPFTRLESAMKEAMTIVDHKKSA